MTAKEMFEELGYELYECEADEEYITYVKRWVNVWWDKVVSFDLKRKYYNVRTADKKTYKVLESIVSEIDMHLHKAIQKQIEELGWE